MGLRIVGGRAGSGKTERCINEIMAELKRQPLGPPLLYIVPEQASFAAETELLKRSERKGMIRAQVLSFQRLASRAFQDLGIPTHGKLNELGKFLLVYRLIQQHQTKLALFGRGETQVGLIDKLVRLFDESIRYGTTPLDFARMRGSMENVLEQKCAEIAVLFEAYCAELHQLQMAVSDPLADVAGHILNWSRVRGARIWIDAFHDFTPVELHLIIALAQVAEEVTITLSLANEKTGGDPLRFGPGHYTYRKLIEKAKAHALPIQEESLRKELPPRFHASPALQRVEAVFAGVMSEQLAKTNPIAGKNQIWLRAAAHPRAEVEAMAQQILRIVRTGETRFKDVLVATRDGAYQQHIRDVFSLYGIPFYMDQKNERVQHPLFEMIYGALDVLRTNWRVDAVLRVWKSSYYVPNCKDDVRDAIENWLLMRGLRGASMYEQAEWPESLSRWKNAFVQPMLEFFKQMSAAKTAQARVDALSDWLERCKVLAVLQKEEEDFTTTGQLEMAKLPSQLWRHLKNSLEQIGQLLGPQSIKFSTFEKLFQTGLNQFQPAMIPPSFDHVLIADVERSRSHGKTVGFVLGMAEGVFPKSPSGDGIFSESEREQLLENEVNLAPSVRHKLENEPYVIYQALTRVSERLWLSYAKQSETGSAQRPSIYLQTIAKCFQDVKIEEVRIASLWARTDQTSSDSASHSLADLVHPRVLLDTYIRDSRMVETQSMKVHSIGSHPLQQFVRSTLMWLPQSEAWIQKMEQVGQSAIHLPASEASIASIVDELYGDTIQASVSKLETYAKCPYQYFAAYGLRLKPRKRFEVDRKDVGILTHELYFDLIPQYEQLMKNPATNTQTFDQLVADWMQQKIPTVKYGYFKQNARSQAHEQKLTRFLQTNTHVIMNHLQQGSFMPVKFEQKFDFSLGLSGNRQLRLDGVIDRIDRAVAEGQSWVRVIDYKSGNRNFDWSRVASGLELQALTYLDAATQMEWTDGHRAQAAGFFYYGMNDPLISINAAEEAFQAKVQDDYDKQFRLKGYVIDEPPENENSPLIVVRKMDRIFEGESCSNQKSRVLRFETKKDGTMTANAKLLSPQTYEKVRQNVRARLIRSGEDIFNGKIAAIPMKSNTMDACKQCDYRAVCQFDARDREAKTRDVPKISLEKWIE